MTTQEIANRFHELSQIGDWDSIQKELYADHCVSIEPDFAPWPKAEGMDQIRQKGVQFQSMIEEMHGGYCTEPVVAGNYFTCVMGMDVTMKEQGRVKMDEVCVYEVKDGKIVLEQFFFHM